MKNTTENEATLLLVAAQLLQAADKAPGALRKRLQTRAEALLNEADAEHDRERAPSWAPPPMPPKAYDPGYQARVIPPQDEDGFQQPEPNEGPRFEKDGTEGPML
jgi:hypothetical protein